MVEKRQIVVMIDLTWPLPHHHHVFSGIHRYARERGNWECTINPHADRLFNGKQRGRRPDGVIARATPLLASGARKARVPVVNVWLNSPTKGLPTVVHDSEESGRMAARHLLSRAFRRFAYLGVVRDRGSILQRDGFRSVLNEAGYDCTEIWVSRFQSRDRAHWQQFESQLHDWLGTWTPPVGVLALTDLLCRYATEACLQRGWKIPSDVALVGTNNEPLICMNPEPTLSSIDFGFERIGYRAAQMLDQLLDGAAPPDEPVKLAPTELIVRQSTDAFAVDHPVVMSALTFIAQQAHTAIGVDEVARHAATTRRTLARLFQRTLGTSIHETITNLRLERVKRELLETDEALKVIAHRCGFRDAVHLCKVFQREQGCSPSEYRSARLQRQM